jgi:lysophospholipase L1-like esterase
MKSVLHLICLGLLALAAPLRAQESPFRAGDLIVTIGGTWLEREAEAGQLETALLARYAGLNLRFRHLAWSGDTVQGHARSYFGPPAEGMERLKKHLAEIKPSVLLAGFGSAEAWAGPEKIGEFTAQYRTWLKEATAAAGTSPRLILVSPPAVATTPQSPAPLRAYAAALPAYRDAIRTLATEQSATFFDVYEMTRLAPPATTDGLHLSDEGYAQLARLLPGGTPPAPTTLEPLRRAVVEKNRLFFHRWRPQNETYLFGFRKHEQGNNAAEIPLFDPLIAEKEKQIASLVASVAQP